MRFFKILPALVIVGILGLSIVIPWLPLQVLGVSISTLIAGLIIYNTVVNEDV
jgi:hypothetical protein